MEHKTTVENKEVLLELGMSEGETTVYLSLLRLGDSQVNKIKMHTKMHRTTIYDFLDSLAKKGLVSYVIKNNIKFYRAANPSRLEDLLKEKREHLEEIIPNLVKLTTLEKKSIKVEIYEGIEGFKTLVNKILNEAEEFLAFGIEEERFEKMSPHIMKSYLTKEIKLGIKERLITRKGTSFIYNYPHMQYRYMDEKFFSPTPVEVWGNNVVFIIWEPLTIIIIENKDLADAYKKHFELLWKIADKTP